jgi:NitT/TauT family transport system permease protein
MTSAQPLVRRWERVFWPALVLSVILLVWYSTVRWSGTHTFPSPVDVARALNELIQKGLLWRYIADSLFRVGTGYLLAVTIGMPFGLLLARNPWLASTVDPVMQMLRPISPLAWIPLSIVWFGTSNAAAIFLIFLASFFPIVVSTANAVREVPAIYRQAGLNFGLSPVALVVRVVLPAAMPKILVGLRITLGVAWLVVVAAEMIAVNSGLGYLIIDARNAGKRYDLVIAGMLLIGCIGLLLDFMIRRLEHCKSLRWGFRHES